MPVCLAIIRDPKSTRVTRLPTTLPASDQSKAPPLHVQGSEFRLARGTEPFESTRSVLGSDLIIKNWQTFQDPPALALMQQSPLPANLV
jgi:hypothetical protein